MTLHLTSSTSPGPAFQPQQPQRAEHNPARCVIISKGAPKSEGKGDRVPMYIKENGLKLGMRFTVSCGVGFEPRACLSQSIMMLYDFRGGTPSNPPPLARMFTKPGGAQNSCSLLALP